MRKVYWINPVQHNIYKGFLYFLNTFFILKIYDVNENLYNNDKDFLEYNHNKLDLGKIISLKSNMICFYNKSHNLVKNNYRYKNNDLMNKYLIEFNNFIR